MEMPSNGGSLYESSARSIPKVHSPSDMYQKQEPELNSLEPIAIVGIACRLPGEVRSQSQLWQTLIDHRSGQCEVPPNRWNVEAFYHPDVKRPGSMNTTGGYFLREDTRNFENSFFGISDVEATFMDPQQRKLLEVVFECFESAGARLEDLSSSNTGCYVGNFTMDFLVMQARDPEYFHRYTATGMGTTILANRVSHVFNLKGPSVVLDTACSSSLYSLHTAISGLRNGDCDAAIVAGANLAQLPEQQMATMKAGVLSGTSTCHTFDSSADGYGRAEGIAALYIKRLCDAVRDGDPIRSIIRATAVNSNGKTLGITLPSAESQEAVIRKAHSVANLNINQTAYVECHGTGTLVGDPIEVEALSRAFATRPKGLPLLIGGIKPNFGHSEAASGITAIIKASLILESGFIPATIGISTINPNIKLDEWNLEIVTENTFWPADPVNAAAPRRVGVNSFGYGGANAHAVLEAVDSFLPPGHQTKLARTANLPLSKPLSNYKILLPFSASTAESLKLRVDSLKVDGLNIMNLAYTLGVRRSSLPVRGFILTSQRELVDQLYSRNLQTIVTPNDRKSSPFAFVFTGQGAQWAAMGKGLIERFSLARTAIERMDAVLRTLPQGPTWSILEILTEPPETSKINETTYSQPACTAIQIILVDVLSSWGIRPEGVIGHSSGEIAAAYASGMLTIEQAITTAYYRGYVVGKGPPNGQMMAVGLSQKEAEEQIDAAGFSKRIVVGCINSPINVTLSGDADMIDALYIKLGAQNIFRKKLLTGGRAYHSHHMVAAGPEYEQLLATAIGPLRLSDSASAKTLFVSSVTARMVNYTLGPDYWRRNLESPVMFTQALEQLQRGRNFQLIELGPHAALQLPISQLLSHLGVSDADSPYYSALYRDKDSADSLMRLAGNLFLSGCDVDFGKVNSLHNPGSTTLAADAGAIMEDLPPYQWTYARVLWSEPRASEEFRSRKYPRHELLGSVTVGGNLADHMWRNNLRIEDLAWLEDHKIGRTTVYPAAAFLGMAIEAISQTSPMKQYQSLELRNVNIITALTFPDDTTKSVELFTSLRPQSLSGTTKSREWYDFEIVSVRGKTSVRHATGIIRVNLGEIKLDRLLHMTEESLENSAMRDWYIQLAKEDLNFGPSFQSLQHLQIPRGRSGRRAVATADLLKQMRGSAEEDSTYLMHPITIDAMIQAGIISTAAGTIGNLRGQIPLAIEHAVFTRAPHSSSLGSCKIMAESVLVGRGQTEMSTELYSEESQVHAQIRGIRMASYDSASEEEIFANRLPMLRVVWKPDIYGVGLPSPEIFSTALELHPLEQSDAGPVVGGESISRLLVALDLITHKSAHLRILCVAVGEAFEIPQACLAILRSNTTLPRFRSFTLGRVMNGDIQIARTEKLALFDHATQWQSRSEEDIFDLLVYTDTVGSTIKSEREPSEIEEYLDVVSALIEPGGLFLLYSRTCAHLQRGRSDFRLTSCKLPETAGCLILAQKLPLGVPKRLKMPSVVIVGMEGTSRLGDAIADSLIQSSYSVRLTQFEHITSDTIDPQCRVIMLPDADPSFLATLDIPQMERLKIITNNASTVVWISTKALANCENPDAALVGGLSRALMLEQPLLKFFTLDLDGESGEEVTARHVIEILSQGTNSPTRDFEFLQRRGVLNVSRFIPDELLNECFRQKQGNHAVEMALRDSSNCRLDIQKTGQFDTLVFRQENHEGPLDPNSVEVEVRSMGLNAKDYYVLSGKAETVNGTCGLEYSGIVKSIGSMVDDLSPGDRVVVMAPHHFNLVERAPQWACQKMKKDESFHVLSTLCVVFATAIYGLKHRGHLRKGESVLIHSGCGGLGMAAIQVAELAGATIYTTAGTHKKREYLSKRFGIDPTHIYSSRDSSFLAGILQATGGRGVDVVLNSVAGDLLHDSWSACANFGRFVEVGRKDINEAGNLSMKHFSRSTTFTAFDLTSLYNSSDEAAHDSWAGLMKDALNLYRAGQISAIEPLKVFDISKIVEAFRYFGSQDRMGKIAISTENPDTPLQVLPFKHSTKFCRDDSYLLVGCLGGLGGSIAKWMVSRGAVKLVFLGRSGVDRPTAKRLVEDLQDMGAIITVVRGDVVNMNDVQKAVDNIPGVLGGIVQAAMGLDEALFARMSNASWHKSVDPKLRGTWNIHNAVAKREAHHKLDFFLMTSSVSGSVGTATESNYCAANSFLDAFARYRRSNGLQAISLGLGMISEVGYLHENPEIENMLLRKGIQAINQDEFIQIVDLALSTEGNSPLELCRDPLAAGHILTGLESHGLRKLREMGFEGNNVVFDDPRASVLANGLSGDNSLMGHSGGNLGAYSIELANALREQGPRNSLRLAIEMLIAKRFSNLTLTPLAKIDMAKKLGAYGMDSMLAAEFRTWMYRVFKVDIPFLELLSGTMSLISLAEAIETEIRALQ